MPMASATGSRRASRRGPPESTLAEAEAALARDGLWYAPVVDYSELRDDPQARHNEVFREIDVNGVPAVVINHPNRYDGEVPGMRHLATVPGADTRDVLAEIGFAPAEIARLVEQRAAA